MIYASQRHKMMRYYNVKSKLIDKFNKKLKNNPDWYHIHSEKFFKEIIEYLNLQKTELVIPIHHEPNTIINSFFQKIEAYKKDNYYFYMDRTFIKSRETWPEVKHYIMFKGIKEGSLGTYFVGDLHDLPDDLILEFREKRKIKKEKELLESNIKAIPTNKSKFKI